MAEAPRASRLAARVSAITPDTRQRHQPDHHPGTRQEPRRFGLTPPRKAFEKSSPACTLALIFPGRSHRHSSAMSGFRIAQERQVADAGTQRDNPSKPPPAPLPFELPPGGASHPREQRPLYEGLTRIVAMIQSAGSITKCGGPASERTMRRSIFKQVTVPPPGGTPHFLMLPQSHAS